MISTDQLEETFEEHLKNKKRHQETTEGLFDILFHGSAPEKSILSDWYKEYQSDKIEGVRELLQCVIDTTGCTATLDASHIQNPDSITDTLEDLQSQYMHESKEFALQPKGKVKNTNKFKKNFGKFWVSLVNKLYKSDALFDENGWCIETLTDWMSTMSSSSLKSFRQTATIVSLSLLTGLCQVSADIQKEWLTLNRQKNGRSSVGKRQNDSSLNSLQEQKTLVEALMNGLFDGVFVHRFRDSDHFIRADCIHELSVWIKLVPEIYLDSQYLRYLGWMLSDKNMMVRLEALKGLQELFASESLLAGLGAFTERFKKRILQMASVEKEPSVRIEAAHLVSSMATCGLLEEADMEHLLPLLFSENNISSKIAPFVVEYIKEEVASSISEKCSEFKGTEITPKEVGLLSSLKAVVHVLLSAFESIKARSIKQDLEIEPLDVTQLTEDERFEAELVSREFTLLVASSEKTSNSFELTHPALSALWPLINLKFIDVLNYLLMDIPVGHPLELKEEESCVLISMMLSTFLLDLKENDQDHSANLVEAIPRLFGRYKDDYTTSSLDLVIASCRLVSLETTGNAQKLLCELSRLYALNCKPQTLREIAATFAYLVYGIRNETSNQLISISAIMGQEFPNSIEQASGDVSVLNDLFETIISQVIDSLDIPESNPLAALVGLNTSIMRLNELYKACKTELELYSIKGIFSMSKRSLDIGLECLKDAADNYSNDQMDLTLVCSQIVVKSLEIMTLVCLREMVALMNQQAPEDRVYNTVDRVLAIAEALFCGDADRLGMQVSLFAQWAILDQLILLYLAVNGAVNNESNQFVRHVPQDVQTQIAKFLDRMIQLFSFHDKSTFGQVQLDDKYQWSENTELLVATRFFSTCSSLSSLVSNNLLDITVSIPLLKYMGITLDKTNMYQKPLVPILTDATWEHHFDKLFNDFDIKHILEQLQDEEQGFTFAKRQTQLMFRCMLEIIGQSIDLYLMGQSTLESCIHLSKRFVTLFKKWIPSLIKAQDSQKRVHLLFPVISTEIIQFLTDVGERMGMRLYLWRQQSKPKARRLSELNFTSFRSSFMVDDENIDKSLTIMNGYSFTQSLGDLNQSWSVWSPIGATLSQILNHLPPLKEDIYSTTQIVELYNSLLEANHTKPTNSSDWQPFHQFCDAIDKQEKPKKVKKRKPIVHEVEQATPTPKKRRSTRVSEPKNYSLGDDSE